MSTVAAIGAPAQVGMLALAGARIHPAEAAEQVRAAWATLPDGVAVVVLTVAAAAALEADLTGAGAPLTVVMAPWPA